MFAEHILARTSALWACDVLQHLRQFTHLHRKIGRNPRVAAAMAVDVEFVAGLRHQSATRLACSVNGLYSILFVMIYRPG